MCRILPLALALLNGSDGSAAADGDLQPARGDHRAPVRVLPTLHIMPDSNPPEDYMQPLFRFAITVAGTLALAATSAQATPLPPDLQKSLKPYTIKDASLQAGVLRIVMDRPIATWAMYYNMVTWGACAPLWEGKAKAWGGGNIERVEVRNAVGAQGFAFFGGRKECAELGGLKGGESAAKKYIEARTLVCVAGNECRPRRPGELTAGDQ